MFRQHAKLQKSDLAVDMLLSPTEAEAMLKPLLLIQNKDGLHWRSQQVVLGFIVDFYCPRRRLAVEVDGQYHSMLKQKNKDRRRDHILKQQCDIVTLRVSNNKVLAYPDEVAEIIKQQALSRPIYKSWNQGLKYKQRY